MKTKKEFNFNDYKGDYVMWCKTEKEARQFCKLMHEDGRRWNGNSGKSYIEDNKWADYKEYTCYSFNEGMYSNKKWYKDTNYTILEWSNFICTYNSFIKADLKDGMVGITRNGDKWLYLCGGFRNFNGYTYHSQDWFNNNLISEISSSFDIIRISTSSSKGLDTWSKDEYLTMIWEREDFIEDSIIITIDEIKNRLGIDKETKLNIIGI